MAEFIDRWGTTIVDETFATFQMVTISLFFSILIGLPLGVLLVISRTGDKRNIWLYRVLNVIINTIRSVPFIILLFALLPFTRLIVGTSIGVRGVIIPLVIYTAPYLARLIESSLLEVDQGVIEAYQAMGIKPLSIIWHVMIREAKPSIILGITIAVIGLIGATAMAGLVGAGGLGDLAYRFGHVRYQPDVMYVTIVILIIIIQAIQSFGNILSQKAKKD
ncbi:ABC transporter permease [Halolactibacillus alkaliphilus]|uniref:ABC transporter permease n=1 Tax=Halolactibacillus alkaliphilus TaxID=442899 RepID=A0A511WYW3_9BACI|nr:methionine ABC transporter permease [Halolactibacillus alkaliphilus]GEN55868.1 ABC transporter permease [Halolactibacillus alkaliphilus]GGN65821.1 ABC transporter permease [Halolactibacillus alkaliphilus]SFO66349.1 D-methionine transport system permease protein [Halolactibacillus alkaliphilus]